MLGFFTVLWYIVQYLGSIPRASESLQSRGRAVPELASQWVELAELSDERHHALGQKNAHRVEE
jgi:K+/H+ antiporter YhaU regulatory subunit KhtT